MYFVYGPDGRLLYVGKASNFFFRWQNHHERRNLPQGSYLVLKYYPKRVIAWYEAVAIERYNPPLNDRKEPRRYNFWVFAYQVGNLAWGLVWIGLIFILLAYTLGGR